jgi:hypothetical protein
MPRAITTAMPATSPHALWPPPKWRLSGNRVHSEARATARPREPSNGPPCQPAANPPSSNAANSQRAQGAGAGWPRPAARRKISGVRAKANAHAVVTPYGAPVQRAMALGSPSSAAKRKKAQPPASPAAAPARSSGPADSISPAGRRASMARTTERSA